MERDADASANHSRRWFVGAVGAGLVSTLIGANLADAFQLRAPVAVRFFDIVHDPSVAVWMSNGEEFAVVVNDVQTGESIERHDGVTRWSLLELRSEHFHVVERA